MDEERAIEPDCLDRWLYYNEATNTLQERYVNGFWTWLKEQRPEQYEIIQLNQEVVHESQGGTDELFRIAVQRWWNRIAVNLKDYIKDDQARVEYGIYV